MDIEVNVDTDEAQGRIERLTQATEKCTKAFEELGAAIASLGTLIKIPEVKDHIEFFNKDIANELND
ncbi:hypothetical protein [Bacillus thuringiensis]|uniref:hypothetical protein n=1 Tax=Bacillus thuringiensis TaxID=1428 RepID=UPI000BFDDAB8|nr:hypothetical protein [Bacillus thuringiensis]PGW63846.1 hypothetical protein COE21_31600 [Bacillus thuringiensis]